MNISAEWTGRGIGTSAELRATFCLLGVDVAGRRVSRFFDERSGLAHERIAMPAYPVAQGLARFWWQLTAGRTGSIALRRFRDGFALPDVRFSPDGQYVEVQAAAYEYDNPPVTFPIPAFERVPVGEFERDMGNFIADVVDRLSQRRVRRTWLAERWAAIEASQADEDERRFCEAAGAFGVDPYLCDDGEAAAIEMAEGIFGGDTLSEFLAGRTIAAARQAVDWIAEAEASLGERAALPDLRPIADAVLPGMPDAAARARPWEIGYRAAAVCRATLDLDERQVFADEQAVGRLFGSDRFEVAAGRAPGLRAEANTLEDAPRIVVAEFSDPTTGTFSMMRAIGDVLVYGERGRAPVTETYSYRQAVGRAFAVEMLAPAAVLLDMQDQGMTIEEMAAARHVSPRAVELHLANQTAARAA